jgi:hypothetical protein
MFSSSHGDGQLACWSCEEAVHQTALYCPYCSADLQKHAPLRSVASKPSPILPKLEQIDCGKAAARSERTKPQASSALGFMVTLFFMIAGSAFLFLSVIILTFAKAGSFTISWHERSSLPYFGLGLAFVSFGIYMMQQKGNEEIE